MHPIIALILHLSQRVPYWVLLIHHLGRLNRLDCIGCTPHEAALIAINQGLGLVDGCGRLYLVRSVLGASVFELLELLGG